LLRKGGREEGREGSHESSHVRVRNGGRCPASLPGSPPPHVQEAAPRAHGVEGMRWTAASQSARGGLFRAIISGLTRLASAIALIGRTRRACRHCAACVRHCAGGGRERGRAPTRRAEKSLKWLVCMQTVVKEGVNVETGTRKVSATTDLFLHSTAGPGARADRPHTRSQAHCSLLLAPRAFKQFQTRRLFSRPVIQISFLRMAIGTNSSGLLFRRRKISHANCLRGILGYVLHHKTHKMWKACVRVRCGAQKPNLLLSNIPV